MRFLCVSLLVCGGGLAFAQPADLPARLDRQVQAWVDARQFNGSVLVARDGKVLLRKGYGLANAEWNVPVQPDTRFRLGSVTKQFTAMAVLMLEQEGKLKVDEQVCRFVDDCPERWKPITIHHLLTHTSGIPNFTSFPDYVKTMALPSPPGETLKRFRDRNLDFDPGTRYSYSNSGYVLLGLIVEKASGMSYEQYLQKKVLDPLGMKDTGYDHNATVMPRRASGYETAGRGWSHASYIDMTIPHAAGALYSTVDDLYQWDQALYTEKLLPEAARERMFTPFKGDYAYGWSVKARDGVTVISHGGGINGFATYIARIPERKTVAIALCNVLPGQPAKVVEDMLSLVEGKTPSGPAVRKEITLDPKIMQQYVGEYALGPVTLTMSLEDGALFTQLTGQQKFPVFAESETRFFLKVVEAALEFQKDAQGNVTGVVLEQGGRRQTATRKK